MLVRFVVPVSFGLYVRDNQHRNKTQYSKKPGEHRRQATVPIK